MRRPRVVLAVNGLGIGGTERGLVNYALALDRERFDVRVVGVRELGPRAEALGAAGVAVDCAEANAGRLAGLLGGADLVHVYRGGAAEPIVLEAAARAGVGTLVETNVFGLVDPSAAARRFDCRLFLSRMCALRYRRASGMSGPEFHRRHRVLPLALDLAGLRKRAPEPADAKRRLGLDPARPVVGRIGRADDLKWRNLLVDMLPALLARAPAVQVLLVGATPAKRRRLERRGVLERCRLLDPVADDSELAAHYAACDVVISAAEIGESQGLAIAEALALGIPVVTCSTPWVDNAQIELVEHRRTGLLASHPTSFAEAVAALVGDAALRSRLGGAGRALVERELDVGPLSQQLERLYAALLAGGDAPAQWRPSPQDVEGFAAEYDSRARAEFRPLSLRERAQARSERERERAVRVRGLLRPRMLPLALAFARTRLRRRSAPEP